MFSSSASVDINALLITAILVIGVLSIVFIFVGLLGRVKSKRYNQQVEEFKKVNKVEEFDISNRYYAMPDCSPNKELLKPLCEKAELVFNCSICNEPALVITIKDSVLWFNSAIKQFPLTSSIPNKVKALVIPEFKEGFYDFSMGTCPKGHKRVMDD